jgi:hypothetical protein
MRQSTYNLQISPDFGTDLKICAAIQKTEDLCLHQCIDRFSELARIDRWDLVWHSVSGGMSLFFAALLCTLYCAGGFTSFRGGIASIPGTGTGTGIRGRGIHTTGIPCTGIPGIAGTGIRSTGIPGFPGIAPGSLSSSKSRPALCLHATREAMDTSEAMDNTHRLDTSAWPRFFIEFILSYYNTITL